MAEGQDGTNYVGSMNDLCVCVCAWLGRLVVQRAQ